MAVIAIAGVAVGGWPMTIGVAAIVAVISWEWARVTRSGPIAEVAIGATAVVAVLVAGADQLGIALGIAAAGAVGIGLWLRSGWAVTGVVYASGLGLALVALRADPALGMKAVFFVFAVVWGTDVAAYIVGRSLGGPKLWPAVSPGKTWSGAIGGAVAGVVVAVVAAWAMGIVVSLLLAVIAFVLSVVSQGGDLFESSVKRHFGVKDASHLIPGHGGLMDRVDALTFAAIAAALVGWAHAGAADIGQGLLSW
jgi:phosphatidate cytidylyltransferase